MTLSWSTITSFDREAAVGEGVEEPEEEHLPALAVEWDTGR
jgi:hypothetical protein